MANNNNSGQPKGGKAKWILLGLSLLAATGLTFFGIQYYRKNKKEGEGENAPDFKAQKPTPVTKPKAPVKTSATKPTAKLPEKKKGKTPSPAVPSKNSTQASTQTQSTTAPKPIDAKKIATAIHTAALQKNFSKAYEQLRNIKNTKDYSAVSKIFSSLFLRGVRQTLVNGLLSTFKDPKEKDTLNKSFRAMGLKFDGKKWSLSGVSEDLLITTSATNVWKDPKTSVSVPVNMVLGKEVCRRGTFTLFENDKQYFLVSTDAVKPYQS